jgi:hypothetical protein
LKAILKKLIERGEKCEKLVNYQATSFTFHGIDAKTPMVELDFKGFSNQTQILHTASLLADALDDFQYHFCKIIKNNKTDREYARTLSNYRIVIIANITNLRQLFIFVNNLGIENLLSQLNDALNEMNELMKHLRRCLIS